MVSWISYIIKSIAIALKDKDAPSLAAEHKLGSLLVHRALYLSLAPVSHLLSRFARHDVIEPHLEVPSTAVSSSSLSPAIHPSTTTLGSDADELHAHPGSHYRSHHLWPSHRPPTFDRILCRTMLLGLPGPFPISPRIRLPHHDASTDVGPLSPFLN